MVRRWESDIYGNIILSGLLAKSDGGGGDGIIGRIFLNGTQVFNQPIAGTDTSGVNYSLNLTVNVGSTIDLVIDPAANDFFDSTKFIGTVTIPEPSTLFLFLFGLGFVGFLRWRPQRD